eukprot:6215811-Prymnesium_polylepis.1
MNSHHVKGEELSPTASRPVRSPQRLTVTMAARDVYVFRHCVRSTSFNVKHTGMDAAFIHAEDFTDLPLP